MDNETTKRAVEISGADIDTLVEDLVKDPNLLAFIGTVWMDAVNNSASIGTIISKTIQGSGLDDVANADAELAKFAAKMLFFGYHAGIRAEQKRKESKC